MKDTIIGTIVEAGTDQRDGICRLIIETEESELKQLKDLPLFAPALIQIRRIQNKPMEATNG